MRDGLALDAEAMTNLRSELHVTYHLPPRSASPFTGVRCRDALLLFPAPFWPNWGRMALRLLKSLTFSSKRLAGRVWPFPETANDPTIYAGRMAKLLSCRRRTVPNAPETLLPSRPNPQRLDEKNYSALVDACFVKNSAMETTSARDAKNAFRLLIDRARAEPMRIEKDAQGVMAVVAVGEYDRLSGKSTADRQTTYNEEGESNARLKMAHSTR
jgi:hypothetical protein